MDRLSQVYASIPPPFFLLVLGLLALARLGLFPVSLDLEPLSPLLCLPLLPLPPLDVRRRTLALPPSPLAGFGSVAEPLVRMAVRLPVGFGFGFRFGFHFP